MAYDYTNELKKVRDYYEGDPLQKRFSALITGETNAGKTFILRTARKPIHIDSFDPGGTKCIRDLIDKGDVIADTSWENEDPFDPTVFARWMKTVDIRMRIGYFEKFGTYCLDSATTWGTAVMNYQLASAGHVGEAPRYRYDYNPQKVYMTNYIRKLMRLTCDFILTGHLREIEEVLRIDPKTGVATKDIKYRFYTTGDAVMTIPLLFDELYVIIGKDGRGQEPKREMLVDSLGKYIARSRLKQNGLLNAVEPPNIKALLKKIKLNWEDKPRLEV
uniref:Putative ATPase domain containing protein n=1 Tax=viral metagenome TaxID=1070528 RepID=A0A6H1ZYE1_9ZZZZ